MKIPQTGRRKALIVVDLQEAFLKEHNRFIIDNIQTLINTVPYDFYVEAVFYTDEDSLWDIQQDWTCPKNEATKTVSEVATLLKKHQPLQILKHSRSVFKGDQDLTAHLTDNDIEEVHIVGTETNDCVLATAFDAFDSGFLPYVIEECCESATEGRHEMGVKLLRIQGMSNNRCLAKTIEIK